MREIFAYDRIADQPMERAPLPARNPQAWLVEPGDLLFARQSLTLAGAGKVVMVERVAEPTTFESHIIRVRLDERRADPVFYYYLFRSTIGRFLVESIVEQVAAAGIRASDLATLDVPVPPLPEQRRIANVLGSLDDLIETEDRNATAADELWRAVIQQCAGTYQEAPLSSLASFVNGKNFTNAASRTGRFVIRTPEVRSGPSASTVQSDVDADADNIADAGDILFVWSGSLLVGRWLWGPALINQHIFKVLPKAGVPPWLAYWAIERLMASFLDLAADKATTMGHIKREHLDTLVSLPPRSEWPHLDAVIRPLWDESLQARQGAAELASTRDELLPLLMSGRVRASDVGQRSNAPLDREGGE